MLTCCVFRPATRLFHFLLVGDYIEDENDYVILESIGSGVRIGRLSWYKSKEYVVFRVNHPDSAVLGRKALLYASKFGRFKYDYRLLLRIFLSVLHCWIGQLIKEHRIRRIHPREMKFASNSRFLCTELVKDTWRLVKVAVLPRGYAALPASYIQAFYELKLILVDINLIRLEPFTEEFCKHKE